MKTFKTAVPSSLRPQVIASAAKQSQRAWQRICGGILAVVLATIVSGCATQSKVGVKEGPQITAQKIEPEARTLFFKAEKAYTARNFDEARQLFQQVKTKYPKGRAWSMATYRIGTIYYYQEDYAAAAREFEAFLARNPNSELNFDVSYNFAAAEYQLGHYERSYNALSKLKPNELAAQGPRRAEVVYQLTAQTAAALNLHEAAITAYSKQLALPMDDGKRGQLTDNIDYHLNRMTEVAALERLGTDIAEPTTKKRIGERLAAVATAGRGEMPMPVGTSSSTNIPPPTSPQPPSGDKLGSGSAADPLTVGVLLPLTGKSAPYGKRALDGILLAAGHYFRNQENQVRVFVEDTGGSPAQAQQAFDRLVNQHKVMAVIGPLAWKEALAVGERAQALGVLNLSLTGKEGISERGAYLFQNALTPRVQLESLVAHCIQQRDMHRFAILAPNNPFGRDMVNEFWSLVEKYGGRIVGYRTYATDEKDFQTPIKEITGLADPRLRAMEQKRLAQFMDAQKKKNKRESKARMPPVVDFDAIFIPDRPETVAQIAASLAYFDVSKVSLLGTTEWNSDQLYKRGGRYVEGAIFPGGVSLGTKNVRQKEFIRLYSESYGSAPDLLASQSYEAMELIVAAMRRSSADRNDMVNQLSSLRDFETPLGAVSFDSQRIAKRKLPVFQLESNGAMVEVTN